MEGSTLRRGVCVVIAAASGAGKSTLAKAVLQSDGDIVQSISVTTRSPRPGEMDGVHYHFRTRAAFDALVESGGMLEHATVFGQSYGTPRAQVENALAQGIDVLCVVDWQGYRSLKDKLGQDVVGIYVQTPSIEVLRQRLVARGDTLQQVRDRMSEALSEVAHAGEFDHEVLNDDIPRATAEILKIIASRRDLKNTSQKTVDRGLMVH